MNFKIISKSDLIPTIWDGGKTYEYFISPADFSYSNRNFDLRISSASIEKIPSRFTRFLGHHRFLVMLDADLNLNRNGIEERYFQNEIFEFDSNDEIQSFSIGNDFNLMVKKDGKQFDLKVKLLNSEYQNKWMFAFAIEETILRMNQEEIVLKTSDLLIIENQQTDSITLRSNQKVIFGLMIL